MAPKVLFVVLTLVLATTIGINGNLPYDGFRLSISVFIEKDLRDGLGLNATGIVKDMIDDANSAMYQDNLKIEASVESLRELPNRLKNSATDIRYFLNQILLKDSSIPETNLFVLLVRHGPNFTIRGPKFNVCGGTRTNRLLTVWWRNKNEAMKRLIHFIGFGIGIATDYRGNANRPRISKTGENCLSGHNFMEDNTQGTRWSQCSVESLENLYATNKLHCIEALTTTTIQPSSTTEMDLTGEVQLIPAAQVNMSPVLAVHLSKSKYFSIFLREIDGHKITEHNNTCAGRLCAYEAVTNIQNTSSYAMMLCDLNVNLTSLQTQLSGTKIYLFDEDVTIFNVTTIIKG